jgi:hypothetical protein
MRQVQGPTVPTIGIYEKTELDTVPERGSFAEVATPLGELDGPSYRADNLGVAFGQFFARGVIDFQ